MNSCIFCKIINKEIDSYVVAENDKFLAFLSIYPNTKGTTVIIPKKHFSSYIFDLEDKNIIELMLFSKKVAKKLDNFFEDVGRTALVFEGFGVDHIHAKLYPMHGTKKYLKSWSPINSSINKYFDKYEGYISSHDCDVANPDELEKLAKELREYSEKSSHYQ